MQDFFIFIIETIMNITAILIALYEIYS